MSNLLKSNKVFIFALLYSVFFTLTWYFFRSIPSVDTAENFFWGKEFQAGYYKHPPLFALVSGLFGLFFDDLNLANNIISGIFLFASIISLYFLSSEFLAKDKAFLSIILLVSFSVATVKFRIFNANTAQIPFWILTPLFYIYGVNTKKSLHFILCGFFLGLGFLSKYYALLLGFTMFVSLVSNKQTRLLLKTKLPYLALISFLITISPNIYWLVETNFLPFNYIQGQQKMQCSFFECREFVLLFILIFIATCTPIVIYCLFIFKSFKFKGVDFKNPKDNLLFCLTVLPISITTIIFVITGGYISTKWSTPLFFYIPIFILYFWKFEERINFAKRLKIFFCIMLFIWTLSTITSEMKYKKDKGERFKALEQIAIFHTKNWNKTFKSPLKFVSGSTLDAGTFFLFSKDKPSVIPDNNLKFAPFLKEEDLKKNGYIIIEDCKTEKVCFEEDEKMEIMEVVKINKSTGHSYIFVIYVLPIPN